MMKPVVESDYSCTTVAVSKLRLARRTPSEPAPLAFQQEFMWKHFMQPEVPYIVFDVKRLRGALNLDILCNGLGIIVARHESLRTRIVNIDGVLRQQVDEPSELRLKLVSLTGASTGDKEARAGRFLQEFLWKRIDLEAGPLFDVRVLQLGEHDYALALVLHHLVTDALSFNLLLRELWISYRALARGQEPDLLPVSMQYADYARWQRHGRQRWLERHGDYWLRRLANAVSAKLPSDTGLADISPHKISLLDISLEEHTSTLQALAQRLRTTIATVLLALYVVTLSRWTGLLDFVLPYVVSGRLGSMDLNVMGYVGQLLPLRIELSGDETFADTVDLVTREFSAAYEHLDFGTVFDGYPEFLKGASLNGLITSLDAHALTELDCGGNVIAIDPLPMDLAFPEEFRQPSDVYCLLWGTATGIRARCMYRASLFKPRTIECFLEDLRLLAQQVAYDPTSRTTSLHSRNGATSGL